MKATAYHSFSTGILPKGCRYCVRGEKLVLFITGLCNSGCLYCPISDRKKDKDVIFANEWDTRSKGRLTPRVVDIIIKEAKLCDAKGAGITGGDPLMVVDRTVLLIKRLKAEFGKSFHIHLYTPLNNVKSGNLAMLSKAGLDEIRFHPKLEDPRMWHRIDHASEFDWDVGVEIPVIPGKEKETRKLINFIDGKVSFLNLNELEISDTNAQHLVEKGFMPKDDVSYGVAGSEELAMRLLRYCEGKRLNVHYCTCKLKDAVQMAERIKRRAKNVALPSDIITEDGMLQRGAIYLPELKPGFGYRRKLEKADLSEKLRIAKRKLPFKAEVDEVKMRLLTSMKIVKKNAGEIKRKGLIPAIVEEYPTHDAMEIEIEFL
ncbi:MAG: radical SAM protein [Nanoarchaeota archaeon]|nr:radical SAM protein [Nanoarchaeota archaeon]